MNIAPGWLILLCTEKYVMCYSHPDVWLRCKRLDLSVWENSTLWSTASKAQEKAEKP